MNDGPCESRRRALAALLAAAVAPRAMAQAPERTRTVGLLTMGQGAKFLSLAMAQHGWIEGKNLRFEVRRIGKDAVGADALAVELVRSGVDVLVGQGVPLVLALHRATRTIPIVCGGISDPVAEGIARSLKEPGMNVTGLSWGLAEAAVLQLGAMRALLPRLKRMVFVAADGDRYGRPAPAHEAAARAIGVSAELVNVADGEAVGRVLASIHSPATDAVWLAPLPPGVAVERVAADARSRRVAVHGMGEDDVRAGLLMSYWISHSDPLGRIAALVDKILRGADPGKIPFELPDKTSFTLNRGTAKAIGLRVPDEILMRATEVIG